MMSNLPRWEKSCSRLSCLCCTMARMSALSCHSSPCCVKYFTSNWIGRPRCTSNWLNMPGLGFFQHAQRKIGRHDLGAPAGQRCAHLLQAHRDRIRLLPGGGRRAPDADRPARRAGLDQLRQHRLLEVIERDLVAEEERLVGGHRLDHFGRQRGGAALHLLGEFGNAAKARLARQRHQPALDQILLVGGEIEAGTLFQKLTQILIVLGRHDRSPENNRTSFGAI